MKEKNTAGIIAFFLGGLGIHRFYLGQTGLGILYLVFCWTFIPAIIAFIDAIIFWTQSQESFNQKYNPTKTTSEEHSDLALGRATHFYPNLAPMPMAGNGAPGAGESSPASGGAAKATAPGAAAPRTQ